MRPSRSLCITALAAVLVLLAPGPAQAAMEVDPQAGLWHRQGSLVPVCWVDPGFAEEKRVMQAAVERTFARPAPIVFTWREGCPTDGTTRWVKVKIYVNGGSHPELVTAQVGTTALSRPSEWWDYGVVVWLPDATVPGRGPTSHAHLACVGAQAFGHVLGFRDLSGGYHAFPRPVGTGLSNCLLGINRDGLDEVQVRTLRGTYGTRPDRPTALADLDGDGRDDLVAVNPDGIYALRSTGTEFADWAQWSGPFYGQRETAFADIDGDGDDDAIAVDNDAIYLLRSNRSELTDGSVATAFPYWGERRTLFGDVDGDGRADAVAITDDHLWVMRSNGVGFVDLAWWGSRTGDAATTALADYNGDGRADLVTQARGGSMAIEVRLSTGVDFAPTMPWRGWPSDASRGLHFADATGDGRADAIVVGHGWAFGYTASVVTNAWVYPEIGFTPPGYPRGGFGLPAEARTMLVGDVDGDGLADVVTCSEEGVDVQSLSDLAITTTASRWWWVPFYALP